MSETFLWGDYYALLTAVPRYTEEQPADNKTTTMNYERKLYAQKNRNRGFEEQARPVSA